MGARRSRKRRNAKKAGYRSGFEQDVALAAEAEGILVEYEADRIAYQGKPRYYKPDFKLREGVYVETKGRFLPGDRSKHIQVKAQHPEIEIRFVFMQNNPLYAGSTTRYSDWCEQHGFKWALKRIPKEWSKS